MKFSLSQKHPGTRADSIQICSRGNVFIEYFSSQIRACPIHRSLLPFNENLATLTDID
jgi:hypothetical protein